MIFERTRGLMRQGVAEGTFPGGVLVVASGGQVVLHEAYGLRQLLPEPLPINTSTVFDLASLTKPLATALAAGLLAAEGTISLETPLADLLPAPPEKAALSIRHLLGHTGGLPAWRSYYHRLMSAPQAERRGLLTGLALEEPLASLPGEAACYSDLGYVLLGAALERACGRRLDRLVAERIYGPLGVGLHFRPLGEPNPEAEVAATENCPLRGRVLCGEVHDENCWAAGGVCGHAGLFGTAGEVARLLLRLRQVVRGEAEGPVPAGILQQFFERQPSPRSNTWGLGFDHPNRVGSSAGQEFSPRSVGHLGYTGCSFWMDPENDLLVVLLTNRLHPTRDNEAIKRFRPRLHDAAFGEVMSG